MLPAARETLYIAESRGVRLATWRSDLPTEAALFLQPSLCAEVLEPLMPCLTPPGCQRLCTCGLPARKPQPRRPISKRPSLDWIVPQSHKDPTVPQNSATRFLCFIGEAVSHLCVFRLQHGAHKQTRHSLRRTAVTALSPASGSCMCAEVQ